MKFMTKKEANEIIFKYMEPEEDFYNLPECNYESLDKLLEVWEKINEGKPNYFVILEASKILIYAHTLSYKHGQDIKEACLLGTAERVKRLLK